MPESGKGLAGNRINPGLVDYFHNTVGYPVIGGIIAWLASPAIAGVVAWAVGWKWYDVGLIGLTVLSLATILYFWQRHRRLDREFQERNEEFQALGRRLASLVKWDGLTSVTDLAEYTPDNKSSAFMPIEILKRSNIRDLAVMANGCSKWTMYVPSAEAEKRFSEIRRANSGAIRFLASCPVALSERTGSQDERVWMQEKAKHNAKSLLALRRLQGLTQKSGGRFEIRTYRHLATLRLIILNEEECIVGHYKEDGMGQSFDTPLLVFKCVNEKAWGFGHAFRRLFDHEWVRSAPPSAEDWSRMEGLAAQLTGRSSEQVLDYPDEIH